MNFRLYWSFQFDVAVSAVHYITSVLARSVSFLAIAVKYVIYTPFVHDQTQR